MNESSTESKTTTPTSTATNTNESNGNSSSSHNTNKLGGKMRVGRGGGRTSYTSRGGGGRRSLRGRGGGGRNSSNCRDGGRGGRGHFKQGREANGNVESNYDANTATMTSSYDSKNDNNDASSSSNQNTSSGANENRNGQNAEANIYRSNHDENARNDDNNKQNGHFQHANDDSDPTGRGGRGGRGYRNHGGERRKGHGRGGRGRGRGGGRTSKKGYEQQQQNGIANEKIASLDVSLMGTIDKLDLTSNDSSEHDVIGLTKQEIINNNIERQQRQQQHSKRGHKKGRGNNHRNNNYNNASTQQAPQEKNQQNLESTSNHECKTKLNHEQEDAAPQKKQLVGIVGNKEIFVPGLNLSIPLSPATPPTTTICENTSSSASSLSLQQQHTVIPKIASNAQMHRIDSVTSMISEKSEKDAKAGSVGVIDLLKNKKNHDKRNKKKGKKDITTSDTPGTDGGDNISTKTKKKKTKSKRGGGGGGGGGLHNDEIAKQRAAKSFNNSVRKCVESSDPDGLYDLLHEKRNHKFALNANVLEIVLKAYVVAAMFNEALYCCKNCSSPGTLSTYQAEKILTCLPQNLRNSSAYVAADMINALCIATKFDKPTHRTYFMRIIRGIALEFLEEVTNARDRICSAPCERLVRSAICVVDAQLRRGRKAADLLVVPGKQLGVFVPDSMETRGIQAGDAVGILPYAGPYPMSAASLDRNMIEATVTSVHPMILRLQDKTNVNLYATLTESVEGNVYRIDKLANRMGFNRQLSAAVALASPLEKDLNGGYIAGDTRRPSPELIKAITAMDENIDRVMINGDVGRKQNHTDELTSTAALCAQPVPFFTAEDSTYSYDGEIKKQDQYDEDSIRDSAHLLLEKYGAFEGLNSSQRLAVEGAATNRLTLVQGPPGTGKTAVAIRIIQHWARLAASEVPPGQSPKPILATSDSNIAVDNLVEGCANVGLKVIRLGRPEAIRPELLRYCIDKPQNDRSNRSEGHNGYAGQNNYSNVFKEKIKALKSAQVICCTCIGSGADILDNMTFERVLVDEATQATEPAVLVPLTRLCRQLVLVGDHCQLPPTVLSTRAEEEGLGVPLFSRMVACGVPPFMLDTQYRMHPSIAMFPSDLFYGGKLLNGVSPPERRPLAGFPWPREEFPVAFVPVTNGVEIDDGVSKMNELEAAAACDAVEALLKGGQCTTSDIAVVTPYAAQVRLIRRLTRKLVNGPPFVEVSSTDGFQGREKEAVVFSAVRSNDYGSVGFVSDWRRVNVSFTRARRGLIVIGNDATLRRGDPETWMPWLDWVNAHGVNMDKPGKTRGRYDPDHLRRVRGGTTAAEMLKDVLARQQQQLQKAEKQIENAQQKSSGQIVGAIDGTHGDLSNNGLDTMNTSVLGITSDLALLQNTEGNWDDSDDDECHNIHNSVSTATLTSLISSTKVDEPQDAWDI